MPDATPLIAPNYLAAFQCSADQCPDTCCQGWEVVIDKPTHQKLKTALGRDPQSRARLKKTMILVREWRGGADPRYARFKMRKDGSCPFLDEAKYCEIQSRLGHEALGRTCATFPRKVVRIDKTLELSGSLSCPEIARACLLDEGAHELATLPDDWLTPRQRHAVARVETASATDSYHKFFKEIRAAFLELAGLRRFGMPVRLWMMSYLAHRLKPIFSRKNPMGTEKEVFAEVHRVVMDEQMQAELDRQFTAITVPGPIAIQVINLILDGAIHVPHPGFQELTTQVFNLYGCAIDGPPGRGKTLKRSEGSLSHEEVLAAYRDRAAFWRSRFSARLDLYLENYARNFLRMEPYTRYPDLLVFMQDLITRTAVIQFLLLSHPALDARRAGIIPTERQAETNPGAGVSDVMALLDETAIQVFQGFSRAIEHNTRFLKEMERGFHKAGMQTLAHTTLLIKL